MEDRPFGPVCKGNYYQVFENQHLQKEGMPPTPERRSCEDLATSALDLLLLDPWRHGMEGLGLQLAELFDFQPFTRHLPRVG
jgi:hypothetical protein